jgi:hypothetical protein
MVVHVPEALAERLGDEATDGLVTWLDRARAEWSDDVLTAAVDRFEHRLTTEILSVRVDFTRELSTFRQEVTRELSLLRQDLTRDLSGVRVELLKWSFLFWVGQVAAMAGLLAFMLRT